MNDQIKKLLGELQTKILDANAVDPVQRPREMWDLFDIQDRALRLVGLVSRDIRPTEKINGTVRLSVPCNPASAFSVGRLVAALRERGWVTE